jgi:hypothetical protein
MKTKTFLGGIPYSICFNQLDEAFPVDQLAEGRLLRHAELSSTLGIEARSERYYAVINVWRKRQKASVGKVIEWERGEGLKVLNPAQTLGHVETRTKQKIKQTVRAASDFRWVDRSRLDLIGQQRLDHQARVSLALVDHLKASQKEMVIDLAPIKCLPIRRTGT